MPLLYEISRTCLTYLLTCFWWSSGCQPKRPDSRRGIKKVRNILNFVFYIDCWGVLFMRDRHWVGHGLDLAVCRYVLTQAYENNCWLALDFREIWPSLWISCSPHLRSFSSSSLPLKQSGLWSHNLVRNLYLNQCFLMTERAKETRQVAQPRKPEDLQKLLRLVQLAGEVTLQKRKGFFNIQSLTWQTKYVPWT